MQQRSGPGRELLGTRYLAFLAAVATVAGLALKSELLPPRGVWVGAAVLMLWTIGGLAFLHYWNLGTRLLTVDHYIQPCLSIVAASSFSLLTSDWRAHAVVMVGMGGAIFASAYADLWRSLGWEKPGHRFLLDATQILAVFLLFLVILVSPFPIPAKAGWIALTAFATGYRSFGMLTRGEWKAVSLALQVAFGVGVVSLALLTYLPQLGFEAGTGPMAVVLLLTWYVVRGLIMHSLEDALTKNVVFEYALMGGIAVYLIVTVILNR
jgi:hypothetical protein